MRTLKCLSEGFFANAALIENAKIENAENNSASEYNESASAVVQLANCLIVSNFRARLHARTICDRSICMTGFNFPAWRPSCPACNSRSARACARVRVFMQKNKGRTVCLAFTLRRNRPITSDLSSVRSCSKA